MLETKTQTSSNQVEIRYSIYLWDTSINKYLMAYTTDNQDDVTKTVNNQYFVKNMNFVNVREEVEIAGNWYCIKHLMSGSNSPE